MGRKSPHGFKTQQEYMRWYCRLPEVVERRRKWYAEHKDEINRKKREKNALNKKPRKKFISKSYKWLYVIKGDDVQEFYGVGNGAERLYIDVGVIRYALKYHAGYNEQLNCHFVISKEQLTKEQLIKKFEDQKK